MPFERSLPLAKALDPDTLLATRMNGELLDPLHGYPLRLFVPGWYGVASVKWLRRIEVVNQPFRGYFQSVKYTVQRPTERGLEMEVVGPMMPKSEIIRPRSGDVLGPGANRFFGAAWAGEDSVSRVELSTDGGQSFTDTTSVHNFYPGPLTVTNPDVLWTIGGANGCKTFKTNCWNTTGLIASTDGGDSWHLVKLPS